VQSGVEESDVQGTRYTHWTWWESTMQEFGSLQHWNGWSSATLELCAVSNNKLNYVSR